MPLVDPWLWVTHGFQGLVGMLRRLDVEYTPISPEALQKLAAYRDDLNEIIEHQREKQHDG